MKKVTKGKERLSPPKKPKHSVPMVVYSPVEVLIGTIDGKMAHKVIRGALLPKKTVDAIIRMIDKSNSNGLKGSDAVLLMALKGASANLKQK